MSDWLSKIEETHRATRKYNELVEQCDIPETASERMARVIRELARCFKSFHDIPSGNPTFSISALFDAYNNLSDDAKELLKCSDG